MKRQMKQFEVLNWASLFLEKNNCEPKVAEILLQHYLKVTKSEFYMKMQEVVEDQIVNQLKRDIIEHIKTGIPVQHLTGYEYFYGRKFIVNEHVLIPRPETEELIQQVIKVVSQESDPQTPINMIDIGTGSGVIGITLSLELPQANVYGTDISQEALEIAKLNAKTHQANITFLKGDFLQPIINKNIKANYIISNPPYIKKSDEVTLSRTVKNFDPELALFADCEGLAAYLEIIRTMPKVVTLDSKLFFEIGYDQGDAVSYLIKDKFPNSRIKVIQDINGKDRIIFAQLS